jgi:hypothetical protein
MRSLLAHFSHSAGAGGELVFHRADLDLFIQGSLCYQILLVYLAHWLCSEKSRNFRLALSFPSVNVEIFSFYFVIFIGFLLLFKSNALLINFSLRKNTRLNENLLLFFRLQIDLNSIIPLFRILTVFFRAVIRVFQLLHYLWVQL